MLFPSGKMLLTEPEAILGFNLLVPGPNRVLPVRMQLEYDYPPTGAFVFVEHAAAARSDWYLSSRTSPP